MEEGSKKKGYAWAVLAGFTAALAAISAKLFSVQLIKYGLVIFLNVLMWGCYVNSLKALSSLQATVTNFATNFLSSGLAGFFLFEEALSYQRTRGHTKKKIIIFDKGLLCSYTSILDPKFLTQWFAGALLIVVGVLVLSKSSREEKTRTD